MLRMPARWRSLRALAAIVVVCTGSACSNTNAPEPTEGAVAGRVISESGAPVAGAAVTLPTPERTFEATTDSDGNFTLAVSDADYEQLPETFFVLASHDEFAANAIEIRKDDAAGTSEYDPSVGREALGSLRPLAVARKKVVTIETPPKKTATRTIVTVSPKLVHLGNGEFGGTANSQLATKDTAETITLDFDLPELDPKSIATAKVRLRSRGIECEDRVTVNGATARVIPLTPEDGSTATIDVVVPVGELRVGKNTVRFESVDCAGGDRDDFEIATTNLVLYKDVTVGDIARDTVCDTDGVAGITQQLIDQLVCISPDVIVPANDARMVFEPTAFKVMQKPLYEALVTALDANPDTKMTFTSTLRSVAQQNLLHRQLENKRCGRTLVNAPGTSTHERGIAIDMREHAVFLDYLQKHQFKWAGATDAVHFTYQGKTTDLTGKSVLAFQKLWNANHPEALLTEDGAFGDLTRQRLEESPAKGFVTMPKCPPPG